MGCPGAGKGTQSAKLQQQFNLEHISTGDVLRAEIASGSALGKEIAAIINDGNLLPDDKMVELLENIVRKTNKGIIFDGFPRTVAQAQALEQMLQRLGRQLTHVVMIDLPEREVVKRITSRRQCKQCHESVHVDDKNPLTACPACGGELYVREDDTAPRAKHRLEVYHQETLPVKNYYQQIGNYAEVNGNQSPEKVFEDLVKILTK